MRNEEMLEQAKAKVERSLRRVREACLGRCCSLPPEVAQDLEGTLDALEALVQREREATESEAFCRLLAENTTDVVWLLDMETRRFRYVSPSVEKLRGYRPEEVLGQPITFALTPEGVAQIEAALPELVEAFHRGERGTWVGEVEQPCRDGSTVWTEVSISCVRNEDTGNLEVVGVSRDVTAQRQLRDGLVQADRLARVGMLVAGIAHELNTPLSYLLVNLESLQEESTGCVDRRVADALLGAQRINEIARGLSSFSRVEDLPTALVSVQDAIGLAATMARSEMKYRARFVTDFEPDLPFVYATGGKLAQVFLNLFVRAAHAVPEGRADANEIRVVTRSEHGGVLVEIADSGPGIPVAAQAHLFELLYAIKQGQRGSLSLAISREIVVGLGGTLDFHTGPAGTVFRLWLPRAPRATDSAAVNVVEQQGQARILVVDDEPSIHHALARILRPHQVVGATSGSQAETLIERDPGAYDLILCDVMMEDLTGIDVHRWLARRHPVLAERLIFLTGGLFLEEFRRYLDRVACLRISKPFELEQVQQTVNAVLARKSSEASFRQPAALEGGLGQ